MSSRKSNLLLFFGVVILAAIPILIVKPKVGEEVFTGADGQAEELITRIQPDYEPWFSSFWEPPSGEIESLLFSIQAAIGAGFLGYYFGLRKGQGAGRQPTGSHASD